MNTIVVSVPHSGTTFMMYMLHRVFRVDAKYFHFQENSQEAWKRLAELAQKHYITVVVPWRDPHSVLLTSLRRRKRHHWSKILADVNTSYALQRDRIAWLKRYSHATISTFCVERAPCNLEEMMALSADVGAAWDDDAIQFFNDWPRIGSRLPGDSDTDDQVLDQTELRDRLKEINESTGNLPIDEYVRRFELLNKTVFPDYIANRASATNDQQERIIYHDPELRDLMLKNTL